MITSSNFRKKHKGQDWATNVLHNSPAASSATASNTPPSNPQVGEVWVRSNTGDVYTWNGTAWYTSGIAVAQDDEDLVEIQECKECSYELKSHQDHEWGLCPKHMPDFDAAFTANEQELYMGKHNGGAMAVGFVRRINQLELLVENLQEQIIELSKGDN